LILTGIFYLSSAPSDSSHPQISQGNQKFIGGDLYTLTSAGKQLYRTENNVASESTDGGKSWLAISPLDQGSVISWPKTLNELLDSGHPGLYRTVDGGATFTKIALYGEISKVHSIGSAENDIYLGSSQLKLSAIVDLRGKPHILPIPQSERSH
jgi:hypothetical protein